MSQHRQWAAWAVAACCTVGGLPAWAQGPSSTSRAPIRPYERPVTSPYLNLLGGNGAGFTFNYFQRTRPELEFRQANVNLRRSLSQVQREVRQLQQQGRAVGNENLLTQSGHATSFLNYGGYFNNNSPGGGRGTSNTLRRPPGPRLSSAQVGSQVGGTPFGRR